MDLCRSMEKTNPFCNIESREREKEREEGKRGAGGERERKREREKGGGEGREKDRDKKKKTRERARDSRSTVIHLPVRANGDGLPGRRIYLPRAVGQSLMSRPID